MKSHCVLLILKLYKINKVILTYIKTGRMLLTVMQVNKAGPTADGKIIK